MFLCGFPGFPETLFRYSTENLLLFLNLWHTSRYFHILNKGLLSVKGNYGCLLFRRSLNQGENEVKAHSPFTLNLIKAYPWSGFLIAIQSLVCLVLP